MNNIFSKSRVEAFSDGILPLKLRFWY